MDQDKNGNPFRPNGILAQEAEEIVNLIKQGKPITPRDSPICDQSPRAKLKANQIDNQTDSKKKDKKSRKDLKEIEVNKSVITNKEASFAEQVILPEDEKKKKESLCCVIQ